MGMRLTLQMRGRTFAEVDEMFEAGVPPRKMNAYVTETDRSGAKVKV